MKKIEYKLEKTRKKIALKRARLKDKAVKLKSRLWGIITNFSLALYLYYLSYYTYLVCKGTDCWMLTVTFGILGVVVTGFFLIRFRSYFTLKIEIQQRKKILQLLEDNRQLDEERKKTLEEISKLEEED